YRAARRDHAYHLSHAPGRLGDKEDHQRHDRHVEGAVRERQRHRIALAEFCHRCPASGACIGQLPIRRIDPLNVRGCAPGYNQLGERTVAAADIDPFQAFARRQPIVKDIAGKPAPGAHHPLIVGAVLEAYLMFSHRMLTLVRSRSKLDPRAALRRLSSRYANVCTITGPATAVAGPTRRGPRSCSIQASARLFASSAPAKLLNRLIAVTVSSGA